jgi:hypothetical protein
MQMKIPHGKALIRTDTTVDCAGSWHFAPQLGEDPFGRIALLTKPGSGI